MRLSLAAILAVVAALAGPQLASAATAIPFADCGLTGGFQCASFPVPLDRGSAGLAAQVSLYLERKPASSGTATSALIALAGGPGQSATPFAEAFAQLLAPALKTRDLIVYDQRGTGRSGFLSCPGAEQNARSQDDFTSQCATELGSASVDYSTRDSVDDIESIRQALGVDKISIFGVSYGTYVAQLYARRYPTHVESLILDSVVPPDGVDPFYRTSFRAIRAELLRLCAGGSCRGITKNVLADATRLTKEISTQGIPFTYVDQRGKPFSLRMTSRLFFYLFEEGLSFDEVSRARLPAALVSALHGDGYPLGQIVTTLIGPGGPDADPTADSTALNLATFCTDTTFPWLTTDSLATRRAKTVAAVDQLPLDTFLPFPRGTVLDTGAFDQCIAWPGAGPITVPQAPPDVPVLVLSGNDDMLTPYEDAVAVAKEYPHASVLRVPNVGHSVVTTSPGESAVCVEDALTSFVAGQPVQGCGSFGPNIPPRPVDPTSIAGLSATGARGLAGKTATAVLRTLDDTLLTMVSRGSLTGLRGGTIQGTTSDFTLDRVIYVPGVVVSGTVDWETGVARLQVTGKGLHGTLAIERGVGIAGKLGGVRVRAGAVAARLGNGLRPLARTVRRPSARLLTPLVP